MYQPNLSKHLDVSENSGGFPQLIHGSIGGCSMVFHDFPPSILGYIRYIPLILVETSQPPQMPPGKKQTKNLGLASSQFIRLTVHHFSGNLPRKKRTKRFRRILFQKKSIHTQTKHDPLLISYIYIYLDLPKGAKWFLKGVN